MPTAAIQAILEPSQIALRNDRKLLLPGRPLVMGVLNITPDSFSDGGLWLDPHRAVERAVAMVEEGAELLDLGAESTRPGGGVYGQGAELVPVDEELRRLLPVLEAVRARVSVPISVDTRKGIVARAAIAAGADLINDISALADPDLAAEVARSGCPVVLMHSRGSLDSMQRKISFEEVVPEVISELASLAKHAEAMGIERQRIVVDPGIGFGKTAAQNLEILRRLDEFQSLHLPLLVGASRKSFIGEIDGSAANERLPGSLAAVGWAARHGVAIIRVHDVAETAQFLGVWKAIAGGLESDS